MIIPELFILVTSLRASLCSAKATIRLLYRITVIDP